MSADTFPSMTHDPPEHNEDAINLLQLNTILFHSHELFLGNLLYSHKGFHDCKQGPWFESRLDDKKKSTNWAFKLQFILGYAKIYMIKMNDKIY